MAGLIALVGGDEFLAGCEEMDRAILDATGAERPRVLILPTAAARQNPSKAAANGVAYFSELGAEASALMALGPAEANDEALLAPLDAADVIYLAGGDPSHLLDTLRGSLLLEKVRHALDRGAVLAGSSAGAMVLGSSMRFGGWRAALGLVGGVAVLPHHERSQPAKVADKLRAAAPTVAVVLGIDGKTACFGGPEGWQVHGPGAVTTYSQGRWQRYLRGDAVPLGPLVA